MQSLEDRHLLAADVLQFDYIHTVLINGEQEIATAEGTLDFTTGVAKYDGEVSNYIEGYRDWGVSWLTTVVTSGGPIVAIELGQAQNLCTITDGVLEYDITVQTQDEFADIVTEIQVRRDGDTIFAELISEGTADYPRITGMSDGPMLFTQMPIDGGFTETGTKSLLAEDGSIIQSHITATFGGVELSRPQVREVNLRVLEVSDDFKSVSIELTNEVRESDVVGSVPFDYTHNILINGERAVGRVTGNIDPATGVIRYDGVVDNYISGYRYWGTSYVTLAMTSGGPIWALERLGGTNIFSATGGELDYGIDVETRDDFASIDTEIKVRFENGTLFAELNSEGTAEYPDIVGMVDEPVRMYQTPTGDGFIETGTKRLVAADGSIVESRLTARFRGISLSREQLREVTMDVIHESEDFKNVTIELSSTVRANDRGADFGDFDGDGTVDFPDFLILAKNFGLNEGVLRSHGDANGDGEVNFPDFLELSSFYGRDVAFGFLTDSMGNAQVDARDGVMTVANIGSSGEDGVALQLDGLSESLEIPISPISLDNEGGRLAINALATVDGQSNVTAGFAAIENVNGGIQISAELSYGTDIGQVLVEVYQDGEFVGRDVTDRGTVAAIDAVAADVAITGFGKLFPGDPGLFCYWIDFQDELAFDLAGGLSLSGNQIRLLVPGGREVGTVTDYSRATLTAQNIDSFEIQEIGRL